MSNKVLYDNFRKEWCNIRCNNLIVDGTFTSSENVSVNTYQELKDAVAESKKYISVDTDLVADSNLEIPQTTFIEIILNSNINFGDYSIDFNNHNTTLILYSGSIIDISISYAPQTQHPLCINDSTGATLKMQGLKTNNNGTLANCPISSTATHYIVDCFINANSYVGNNGLSITSIGYCNNTIFNNTELFINSPNVVVSNCIFSGTNQIINVNSATGSKLLGCSLGATTGQLNIDNLTSDFILCNNYKTAGVTITDNGITTRKAGNNF